MFANNIQDNIRQLKNTHCCVSINPPILNNVSANQKNRKKHSQLSSYSVISIKASLDM